MIQTRTELKEWLLYEAEKYKLNIFRGGVLHLFGSERAVIWSWQRRLRITEYYKNSGKKFHYRYSQMLLNKKSNKYGLHIGINVFGMGLKIMHLGPILTNGNVRAGRDCSVHINTALVAQGVSDGVPQIGDNVVIGVGVTILGDVYIANGVAIGAGAVVNKSFTEENIAIAGVPAKKISNNGTAQWNTKKPA